MGKCVYLSFLLLFVVACSSTPNPEDLKFSYLDGLTTAKTVSCASREPMDCMACALQGEAADQSGRGIYAVGITIMTRAKGRVERICRVTKARRQFEGMKRRGRRKVSRKVWQVTEYIIKSKKTGWTHFWAPKNQAKLKRSKPRWASIYEKRQCKQEKIGDHIFYDVNQCKLKRSYILKTAATP